MGGVTAKKFSVALDEQVYDAARRAADREGVSLSAWLSRAAVQALALADGLAAVAEWEGEHGAFTEAERAWARGVLDGTAAVPDEAA